MATAAKQKQLEELTATLQRGQGFIVSTYSGLNVAQLRNLRAQLREKEGQFKVVKNRIFYLSLKQDKNYQAVAEQLLKQLHGPLALTFTGANFPAVSKVLFDYSKSSSKLQVKAGYFEGAYLDSKAVSEMAALPGREELLAMIARGLQAPATAIANGLQQVITALARGIQAVAEKK